MCRKLVQDWRKIRSMTKQRKSKQLRVATMSFQFVLILSFPRNVITRVSV